MSSLECTIRKKEKKLKKLQEEILNMNDRCSSLFYVFSKL